MNQAEFHLKLVISLWCEAVPSQYPGFPAPGYLGHGRGSSHVLLKVWCSQRSYGSPCKSLH